MPQCSVMPPRTQVDLATLPDGTLLLALNDNSTARSPLSLATSRDGGATWRRVAVLEQDDAGNFHYPTVLYVPGRTRRERVCCCGAKGHRVAITTSSQAFT